ncbi:hypothetical protein LCGC14_0554320 [marine sediment metagenome]|uniref:IraD/Gp25-like domain-containing protein n=1 Tax=marine sediment metagenome TaxID=412755 RepID=A0A0F9S7G6_9ZZZZ
MARQLTTTQRLFRGFSSIDQIKPGTEITDIDLVKRDLLNHFFTMRGERVMRPEFGSIIWNLLFEPFNGTTREAIIADVQSIIAQEPRVELDKLDILEFEHGIRLNIAVFYVPFKAFGTFEIEFDRRNRIQHGTQSRLQIAEEI